MPAINPTLLKLRVQQTKCPIHKGQILPLCSEKLRLNNDDSLNNASFVYVSSVSKMQSHSSKEGMKNTYKIAVTPVEWDKVKMKWAPCKSGGVSPHPFDISVSSDEMYEHFAAVDGHTAELIHSPGLISGYLEKLFEKAHRHNEWVEHYSNYDFDKAIMAVASKVLAQNTNNLGEEEKKDLVMDAVIRSINEKSIERFNPEKASLRTYLWNIFRFSLLNVIKHRNVWTMPEEKLPAQINDETEEENLDRKKNPLSESDTSEKTDSKVIIEDFKEYLSVQPESKVLVALLEMLPQGFTQVEMAKKAEVPPHKVARMIVKLIEYLREYAVETDNDLLISTIKDNTQKKESSQKLASTPVDVLRKILQDYDEHQGSSEKTADTEKSAERVPVGEKIIIKRKPLPNLDDLTKQVVQDPNKSSSQAVKEVETYLADLIGMDELIEHEGKLIGLKVSRK